MTYARYQQDQVDQDYRSPPPPVSAVVCKKPAQKKEQHTVSKAFYTWCNCSSKPFISIKGIRNTYSRKEITDRHIKNAEAAMVFVTLTTNGVQQHSTELKRQEDSPIFSLPCVYLMSKER